MNWKKLYKWLIRNMTWDNFFRECENFIVFILLSILAYASYIIFGDYPEYLFYFGVIAMFSYYTFPSILIFSVLYVLISLKAWFYLFIYCVLLFYVYIRG